MIEYAKFYYVQDVMFLDKDYSKLQKMFLGTRTIKLKHSQLQDYSINRKSLLQ